MHYLLYFILLFAANSGALYLLDIWGVVSIELNAGIYLVVTLVWSLFNVVLKPILKLLTFPLFILTFGLFAVVINIFLLWLTAYVVPNFEVVGVLNLVYATILLSLIHTFIHSLMGNK